MMSIIAKIADWVSGLWSDNNALHGRVKELWCAWTSAGTSTYCIHSEIMQLVKVVNLQNAFTSRRAWIRKDHEGQFTMVKKILCRNLKTLGSI